MIVLKIGAKRVSGHEKCEKIVTHSVPLAVPPLVVGPAVPGLELNVLGAPLEAVESVRSRFFCP